MKLILLIICLQSCTYLQKRNVYIEFVNSSNFTNSSIKINGYYYSEFDFYDNYSKLTEKTIHTIIMYNDGTFKWLGNFGAIPYSTDSLTQINAINTFQNAHELFQQYLINNKWHKSNIVGWGHYKIENDSLNFMFYHHGPANFRDYYLFEGKGKILTDSSFIINSVASDHSNRGFTKPRIYNFRGHSVKLDSSNYLKEYFK